MSIIGNGDIASALKEVDRDDIIFFASGVSNSQEIDEKEYDREFNLLLKQDRTKHIVYFSTLALFYSSTRYTAHKFMMEQTVKNTFSSYTIIRIGNITWGDNPNTLINYLRTQLNANKPITVRDEWRYLVDKEEFVHWIKLIPSWNCEMDITGKRLKVADIVEQYVKSK